MSHIKSKKIVKIEDLIFCTVEDLSIQIIQESEKFEKLIILMYANFSDLCVEPVRSWIKHDRVCPMFLFNRTQEDVKKSVVEFFTKRGK